MTVGEGVENIHSTFFAHQYAFVFHFNEVVREKRLLRLNGNCLLNLGNGEAVVFPQNIQNLESDRVGDSLKDFRHLFNLFYAESFYVYHNSKYMKYCSYSEIFLEVYSLPL